MIHVAGIKSAFFDLEYYKNNVVTSHRVVVFRHNFPITQRTTTGDIYVKIITELVFPIFGHVFQWNPKDLRTGLGYTGEFENNYFTHTIRPLSGTFYFVPSRRKGGSEKSTKHGTFTRVGKGEKDTCTRKTFRRMPVVRSCIGDISNKSSVFFFYLTEISLPMFFLYITIDQRTWNLIGRSFLIF